MMRSSWPELRSSDTSPRRNSVRWVTRWPSRTASTSDRYVYSVSPRRFTVVFTYTTHILELRHPNVEHHFAPTPTFPAENSLDDLPAQKLARQFPGLKSG